MKRFSFVAPASNSWEMLRALVLLLALCLFLSSARAGQLKVACAGDSITLGILAGKGWDYPSQLQRMLGSAGYAVRNFGVSGATLLIQGDRPYVKQPAFRAALDWKPDIVILMLGANDSKPYNWDLLHAQFEPDYRWLISQFRAANPALKLFLCRPTWVAGAGKFGINDAVILEEVPIIDKIAASLNLQEIDMHAALAGHPEDLVDTVHPNKAGATLMALAAYAALTGGPLKGPVPAPAP